MVHAIPVTGANGAGGYMCKYMGKEFDGKRAEALGMARRWSNSGNWPGERRNRFKESKAAGGPGYARVEYRFGHVDDTLLALSAPGPITKQRELTVKEDNKAKLMLIALAKKKGIR